MPRSSLLAKLKARPLAWLLPVQAALLLARLDSTPLWGDESFTLHIIGLNWSEIPAALRADIHPPLYFALLKLWALVPLPGELIERTRAFSALWALASTALVDRFWARRLSAEQRLWLLALLVFSPALVLYARMARSYSMQLALAILAFAAGERLARKQTAGTTLAFAAAAAALLYTHYLPGIAVLSGVLLRLAWLAWRDSERRFLAAAAGAAGAAAVLYLPWAGVLWEGIGRAAEKQAYHLAGSAALEHALRLGYWFFSFHFGEAASVVFLVLSALAAPLALWAAARGTRIFSIVSPLTIAAAAAVGYLGTARWTAFAFVPARLLFLLPPYLALVVAGASGRRKLGRLTLGLLLALAVGGDWLYFRQDGFLNKGYLIPFDEMAEAIRGGPRPEVTLVLVDAEGADPRPLVDALGGRYRLLRIGAASAFAEVEQRLLASPLKTVWLLERTRESSPERPLARVRGILERDYLPVSAREYLPYSTFERRALEILSRESPPKNHYRIAEYARAAVD